MNNFQSESVSVHAAANGAGGQPAAAGMTSTARSSAARRERMAQTFADVVAVLMRDPGFKNLRLAELEWLVIPPILSGQWRIAQSRAEKPAGAPGAETKSPADSVLLVPVAVALWATVSPEIDKRLSKDLDKPLLLRPSEWASGDIPWLIAVAGDRRAIPKFVKRLEETQFKGKQVKLRTMGKDGKISITTLGNKA